MEKIEEKITKIELAITKLLDNKSKIVFLSPDTKGAAKASVSMIYRMALVLQKKGYSVEILTERADYMNPSAWLGAEYGEIPHTSIEKNQLVVGPQDFIVIPEVYGSVFEQILHMPVEKILLSQVYDFLLDGFSPGKSWVDFDVSQVITTSKTVADMIQELTPKAVNFIEPYIPEYFKPSELPTKPIIGIYCSEQKKAAKIIKTFYLKYPLYRFISFKDMHGMSEKDFSNNLKECAVSIWVDDDSTFGTFPVESILCNVPVIGKVPNIIPEWMLDNNGIWVYDENQIPELVFNYIKNWLEDTLPENLENVSTTLEGKYTYDIFEKTVIETFEAFKRDKIDYLEKIKETLKTPVEENDNK